MSVLIDKVAQRLGVSRERADDLVHDLVENILTETEHGSEVRVTGLGSFRRAGGGLEFEPESRLSTVVNHRFAGLSPIPVQSAGDSGGVDEADTELLVEGTGDEGPATEETRTGEGAEPDDEADIFASDQFRPRQADQTDISDKDGEDHASGLGHDLDAVRDNDRSPAHDDEEADVVARLDRLMGDEEPAEGAEPEGPLDAAEPEGPLDTTEPEARFDAAESEERFDTAEPEGPLDAAEAEGRAESAGPADDEPIPERTEGEAQRATADDDASRSAAYRRQRVPGHGAPTGAQARARSTTTHRTTPVVRRKSHSLLYVVLIVILIAAIAGMLYLLSRSNGVSAEPEAPVTTESSTEPPSVTETETVDQPDATTPPMAAWQPGAIDRRAGGYTLVVASRETTEEANEAARQFAATFADDDLPVDVLEGTARGETWYRVAVGQFPQESTADEELRRLADRLPEGAWVLRIRSHM